MNQYVCTVKGCEKPCKSSKQAPGTLGTWRCPVHGKVKVRREKL